MRALDSPLAPYPSSQPCLLLVQAADLASTSRVLVATISILHKKQKWKLLNDHIGILSRKHGQLRQATQKMVDEAMTYFPELEGQTKLDLIETLREVTEGKVRFTRVLSLGAPNGGTPKGRHGS